MDIMFGSKEVNMNLIREIFKIWNYNFDQGITIFQLFLIASMILFGFQNNSQGLLFSMVVFLFGYFEPDQIRFSFQNKVKR